MLRALASGQDRKGNGTQLQFLAFTLQSSGITSPCRQLNSRRLPGVNYPPVRQRDGTHNLIHLVSTPYIRGSFRVAWPCLLMKRVKRPSGALESECFRTVPCMDGKPRTMRVQPKRRHGDTGCPSGEDTFISTPIPEIMVSDISLKPCYELAGLLTHLLGQMPSYNAWQRIETLQ